MNFYEKISKLKGVDRLKYLFKDTVIYGLSGALNKFLSLISVPLLTFYFNPHEYGIIDYFNFLLLFFSILFIFGQDSAVARYFFEYDDVLSKKKLISQSLIFQVILLVLFLPIFWIFADKTIGYQSDNDLIAKIIILQTPCLLLINFGQNILRWTFDKYRFLFLSVGSNLFTFFTIFISLKFFKVELIELFYAYLFSRVIFSLISIFLVKKWLIIPSNFKYLFEMMPFAIPFGIVCTISALVPTIERTYILQYLSDLELGIYALAYRIALFIALPIEAFQIAWGPFAISLYKIKDSITTYNWILKIFSLTIFSSVLLITFFSGHLVKLLIISNPNSTYSDYYNASLLVFALSMGIAIDGILTILDVGVLFSKKSYIKLYSYFIFLFSALIFIYFFINVFGVLGVAWGSLIAYIIKIFVTFWFSQKVYPLEWEFKKIITIGIFTLIVGIISQFISIYININYGLYFCGLGIIFLILFSWFFIFSLDEKNKIINYLIKIKKNL